MAFAPASPLIAWPAMGCQAPMAATSPEASTCGISLVFAFTSVMSPSFMPAFFRPFSSSRCSTRPCSTATFLPFSACRLLMPGFATIMSLPLE